MTLKPIMVLFSTQIGSHLVVEQVTSCLPLLLGNWRSSKHSWWLHWRKRRRPSMIFSLH